MVFFIENNEIDLWTFVTSPVTCRSCQRYLALRSTVVFRDCFVTLQGNLCSNKPLQFLHLYSHAPRDFVPTNHYNVCICTSMLKESLFKQTIIFLHLFSYAPKASLFKQTVTCFISVLIIFHENRFQNKPSYACFI